MTTTASAADIVTTAPAFIGGATVDEDYASEKADYCDEPEDGNA